MNYYKLKSGPLSLIIITAGPSSSCSSCSSSCWRWWLSPPGKLALRPCTWLAETRLPAKSQEEACRSRWATRARLRPGCARDCVRRRPNWSRALSAHSPVSVCASERRSLQMSIYIPALLPQSSRGAQDWPPPSSRRPVLMVGRQLGACCCEQILLLLLLAPPLLLFHRRPGVSLRLCACQVRAGPLGSPFALVSSQAAS